MTVATESYLKELETDRRAVYEALHKQIELNRKLRYGEHDIPIPEAYQSSTQVVRSPIVPDILFRVVATLTTDDPRVSVPPFAATEKAKRNASLREKWSMAGLHQMEGQCARDVFRMGIDAAASDGLGVWKLIDRRDVWKGFPRRGKGDDGEEEDPKAYLGRAEKFVKGKPFPMHWTDVDPVTYFPLPGPYGLEEVLEITKRAAVPAMKQFGKRRVKGQTKFENRRPGESYSDDNDYAGESWDLVEHWDNDTVTYTLDGEIIDQRTVNYGRPPYFPLGGHMTSSRQPERMYQSVIQPFAHLIPTLDSVLTMTSNWVYLSAYPFLKLLDPNVRMRPTSPGDPLRITDIKPGDVLQNVEFLVAPSVSKGISDMVNLLNMMIDRSGLAAVMYGQGSSSSSGYMVSQLMTAAQLVYAPITKNARMAMQQLVAFMWQLVERRLKREVYVWGGGKTNDWLGLSPDDVDGYYACEVNVKPTLPMDAIGERDSAIRMVGAGLWSEEYAREQTGIEQPEEMADQVAVERFTKEPEIYKPIMLDAARRAGIIKPEPPPPPTIFGPNGEMLQGGPPGIGGPQGGMPPGMPPIQPMGPQIPGAPGSMPLVPPGTGGPPIVAQRQPGGNFGPPPGNI